MSNSYKLSELNWSGNIPNSDFFFSNRSIAELLLETRSIPRVWLCKI